MDGKLAISETSDIDGRTQGWSGRGGGSSRARWKAMVIRFRMDLIDENDLG